MTGVLLFTVFIVLMLAGVPIGVSLGIGGMVAIALANSDTQLFGLFAAPQNFYASIAKYPLLALPMFVLVGAIFDRSGVAQRLVTFAIAVVGRGPGMLPMVAILVAMVLGGISGSGPANAAAAALRDNHIRIEFFLLRGSAARRRRLVLFGALVSAVFFLVLAALTGRMAWDDFKYMEISMGLGVPRWWYTAWVPALSLVIAFRSFQVLKTRSKE